MNLVSKFAVVWIWLAGLGLALEGEAQAQVDVVVSFVTTNATPLNPGFGGFNNGLKTNVEYYDTNFQQMAATLSPGWLRFPAGTESEAFDRSSGQIVRPDQCSEQEFLPEQYLANALPIVAGKGGSPFSDFAAMAAKVGGAKIIVAVNTFTDTSNSAGAFAQYALTNRIPVAAWEVANGTLHLAALRTVHQRGRLRRANETLPGCHQGRGFQCRGRPVLQRTPAIPIPVGTGCWPATPTNTGMS